MSKKAEGTLVLHTIYWRGEVLELYNQEKHALCLSHAHIANIQCVPTLKTSAALHHPPPSATKRAVVS